MASLDKPSESMRRALERLPQTRRQNAIEELKLLRNALNEIGSRNTENIESETLFLEIEIAKCIEAIGQEHFRNKTKQYGRSKIHRRPFNSNEPSDELRRSYLLSRIREWVLMIDRGLHSCQRENEDVQDESIEPIPVKAVRQRNRQRKPLSKHESKALTMYDMKEKTMPEIDKLMHSINAVTGDDSPWLDGRTRQLVDARRKANAL